MTRPRILHLAALCLCLVLLAGCGDKTTPLSKAVVMRAAVRAAQPFADMTDLPDKKLNSYLALEADWYTDEAAVFDVSRYTPEAIIVVTAKDNAAREKVKQALQEYRDNLLEEYRTYQPEQLPKLQQAQVREKGLQLVLVIAPDDAVTEQTLNTLWK